MVAVFGLRGRPGVLPSMVDRGSGLPHRAPPPSGAPAPIFHTRRGDVNLYRCLSARGAQTLPCQRQGHETQVGQPGSSASPLLSGGAGVRGFAEVASVASDGTARLRRL